MHVCAINELKQPANDKMLNVTETQKVGNIQDFITIYSRLLMLSSGFIEKEYASSMLCLCMPF